MKQNKAFVCLLAAMLLAGCSGESSGGGSVTDSSTAAPESSEAATGESSMADTESTPGTAETTAEGSTADSQAETQTAEAPGTTAAQDESSTAVTTLFERQEPTAMITTTVTEAVHGGQGGEEHGDDPEPIYFNYRFTEEAVSMRLAGGNYQSIAFDFTEMLGHANGAELYTLTDYNFDGTPDLAVPTHWDGDNVYYIVFIWDPETEKYNEDGLTMINPVVCPKSQLVCEIVYDGKIGAELTQREWYMGYLEMKTVVQANFDALALAVAEDMTDRQPTKTESYDTHEALEAAFLSYLPG